MGGLILNPNRNKKEVNYQNRGEKGKEIFEIEKDNHLGIYYKLHIDLQ